MGKRLFVGSLPFETTEAQLQELFGECGRVESAKIIMDRVTGRSKGFGFIEMATDLEAKAATEKFNGYTLGSRQIVVNEARPPEERPREQGGGNFKPRSNRGGFGNGGGFRREGGFKRDGGASGNGGGFNQGGYGNRDRDGNRGGGYGNRERNGNRDGGFNGGFGGGGFVDRPRRDFRDRDGNRGNRKSNNDRHQDRWS